MRILLFFLLSTPVLAQQELPLSYIIKCDGSIKYVQPNQLKVISEKASLESGLLIKPEGVIVFKTGKEQVLKDREMIDENGNIYLATDSLIQEIRFSVISNKLKEIKYELDNTAHINNLLVKKSILLTQGNTLLNKKADLLSELKESKGKKKRLEKDLDSINLQIKTIESKIREIDKLLPG